MTIRYLKHKEIDFEKWDKCIENAHNGIIYGYSWYLDITSHYWDALVKDDYQAVMPLPCRKKFGINYIYQPAFVQQLGVFSKEKADTELINKFIESIPEKFKFIYYNFNTQNELPINKKFKIIDNQTFELDLSEQYDKIKDNYSTNNKRNIKKAKKSDLFITYADRPEQIITLFRDNKGKKLKTIKDSEYNNLKHLAYSCIHKGIAFIHSVYTDKNNICGGMILVKSHNRIIFLFSGSDEKAKETGAMNHLIDDFINNNAGSSLILDFEGSNHPGTAYFYKGFGSKKLNYQTLIINRMPLVLKLVFRIYKTLLRVK